MPTTERKERGIIFQGDMVRAIQDGRKVMTRRLSGLKHVNEEAELWEWGGINKFGEHIFYPTDAGEAKYPDHYPADFSGLVRCPYGKPGDLLYARETWARCQTVNHLKRPDGRAFSEYSDGFAGYRADGHESIADLKEHIRLMSGCDLEAVEVEGDKWRPSIHMPKWATRLWLEITDIRVERLQDISKADAIAEGVLGDQLEELYWNKDEAGVPMWTPPEIVFARLWDSIDGKKYPWGSNPWCWCLSFRRINNAVA